MGSIPTIYLILSSDLGTYGTFNILRRAKQDLCLMCEVEHVRLQQGQAEILITRQGESWMVPFCPSICIQITVSTSYISSLSM